MKITKRQDRRVHTHTDWSKPATDYWIVATTADQSTVSAATNTAGVDSFGWTATSLVHTNLVTADFFSAADDTPNHFLANASGDLLRSPIMFGSYAHRLLVSKILGYLPTKLCLEFYAAFTVASADEAATYIGFDNAAAMTCAVYSDATNYLLSNDGGTTEDAGGTVASVGNTFHTWKIVLDSGTSLSEWFIDDVSQGTLAIKADVWPSAFVAVASTTNRFALAWAHVWYE